MIVRGQTTVEQHERLAGRSRRHAAHGASTHRYATRPLTPLQADIAADRLPASVRWRNPRQHRARDGRLQPGGVHGSAARDPVPTSAVDASSTNATSAHATTRTPPTRRRERRENACATEQRESARDAVLRRVACVRPPCQSRDGSLGQLQLCQLVVAAFVSRKCHR